MMENDSWVTVDDWDTHYEIVNSAVKTMSGCGLTGDLSEPVPWKTGSIALAFDIDHEVTIRRTTMIPYKMQKDECQFVRLSCRMEEWETNYQIAGGPTSMWREHQYAITNPVNEKLTNSKNEVTDTLKLKLIDGPITYLNKAQVV